MRRLLLILIALCSMPSIANTQSLSTYGPVGKAVVPGHGPSKASAAYDITQSTDPSTIVPGVSVACNSGGVTVANSYLRRFDLNGQFGITGPFDVTSVTIGVENALGPNASGTQNLTLNLYSIPAGAAFLYANMSLVGTATLAVVDQSQTIISLAVTGKITDPAATDLVVEVHSPDQSPDGSFFFGANSLGQTAPSYLATADCGISEPTDLASVGFPSDHLVMIVHGDTSPRPPIPGISELLL